MIKTFFLLLIALLLFAGTDCKDKPPVVPPENKPPDTTSHNFTFTTYTFGGNVGSSFFKDVVIINDSDIWAVGQIYTSPETTYNAAHWDGKEWDLKRIPYDYQGQLFYNPVSAVFALNANEVWFAGNGVVRWNGQSFFNEESINAVWGPYEMKKIWMSSAANVYVVGDSGSIAHYDGTTWSKQEGGTTIDLRDVWGTPDGKVVWACGESYNGFNSILLKCETNQWKTVWERSSTNSVQPFGYNVGSVWGKNQSIYIASSNGVFQIKDDVAVKMSNNFSEYSRSLRGNEEFDMFTVGEGGRAWHYNGVSWKLMLENPNYFLMGANIKNNTAIAVGTDYSIGFGAGLIYIGKHE